MSDNVQLSDTTIRALPLGVVLAIARFVPSSSWHGSCYSKIRAKSELARFLHGAGGRTAGGGYI